MELVVERILAGGIAGIPTDTVYGLAALATDSIGIEALIEAKGREREQPIALLFDSVIDIVPFLDDPLVLDRVTTFWPGALTVVVRAISDSSIVRPVVTETGTIGIRKPDDAFARSVIRACGGLLAVTSANLHGDSPASSAYEVASSFGDLLPVLDGGDRSEGIASTVVDLTVDPPELIREGAIDISSFISPDRGTATDSGASG